MGASPHPTLLVLVKLEFTAAAWLQAGDEGGGDFVVLPRVVVDERTVVIQGDEFDHTQGSRIQKRIFSLYHRADGKTNWKIMHHFAPPLSFVKEYGKKERKNAELYTNQLKKTGVFSCGLMLCLL